MLVSNEQQTMVCSAHNPIAESKMSLASSTRQRVHLGKRRLGGTAIGYQLLFALLFGENKTVSHRVRS
jgi:hypothetical protein